MLKIAYVQFRQCHDLKSDEETTHADKCSGQEDHPKVANAFCDLSITLR